MAKKVFQLTGGALPSFAWRLPQEIAQYKQSKLPAQQWAHVIKGFSQKGIKLAEIDDSKVLEWLEEQGKAQLSRDEVAQYASYALPSIKEARLTGSDVGYRQYSWAEAGEDYNESLFYFPTVTEDLADRIADLDEKIASLNFDFDALGRDPNVVFRLDEKRQALLLEASGVQRGVTLGTHFSERLQQMCPDARADFAHMRWSVLLRDGKRTLFVHEFQSDWAQKGRQAEWQGAYKRAPLVTETEYWTGFLMRRAMLLAVEFDCEQLTWINGTSMANGGRFGSAGLDEFYLKIVPSIAKKLAKPFKSELFLHDFSLRDSVKRMAVMPVTDEMRQEMRASVPVYSHANLVADATFDPVRAAQLRKALQLRANEAFGEGVAMRVSIVREILDAYGEHRPAAALIGKVAHVAFNAADPVGALDHEGFHFAYRYHFTSKERSEVRRQFAAGSPMLVRTWQLLMRDGNRHAAQQCMRDPEEAAAHAYSLWRKGKMDLKRVESAAVEKKGVARILQHFFPAAQDYVRTVCQWIRGSSVSPRDFVAKIVRAAEEGRRAATLAGSPTPEETAAHIDDDIDAPVSAST